ncbi:MAG: hypothetical protein K9J13_05570 [Saprospiraceae bacterium]|nr:hypothetical protein [Saprospiraceae bacterium]
MTPNFFETNSYFIDEKVNLLKFENAYKVFDDKGVEIGSIRQKLTGGQKMLRLILDKKMLPFTLEVKDKNEKLLSSIHRGWTFFMSKITLKDANGMEIGTIKQKFKLLKPRFEIFDTNQKLVAVISGDWKAWNFTIKNSAEKQIGTITKKWAGAVKEIFTTADKYNVNIESDFANETAKVLVVSSAITIDMVLKEAK